MQMKRILFGTILTLGLMFSSGGLLAQSDVGTGLDVFPNLSLGGIATASDKPSSFTAEYTRTGDSSGELSITATMAPGWHIYSITQAAGGPTPTTITLGDKSEAKLIGEFKPDSEPLTSVSDAWPGLTIEEHDDEVEWSAEVSLPPGFSGPIEVKVKGLVCQTGGACVPVNQTLVAKLAAGTASAEGTPSAEVSPPSKEPKAAPVASVAYREAGYVVEWTGRIEPANVEPGQRAKLILTATPDADYHVYAAAVNDKESSTVFVLTDKAGLKIGTPVPSSEPISESILPGIPAVDYHKAAVTWSLPIVVGEDTPQGEKQLTGLIAYQACTDRSCLPPKALKFTANLHVGKADDANEAAGTLTFAKGSFPATLDAAKETKWVDQAADRPTGAAAVPTDATATRGPDMPSESGAGNAASVAATQPEPVVAPESAQASGLPLPLIILMALGGGLILNLMPCVLPVVGLKIMSFAEQAGESRTRVLALNIWYTLGILVVFWSLAATAVLLKFSWGEQFTYFNFRFAVTLLVFAMALSFLGVWEIPIPGFVGGQSTQKLQRKEGAVGAFFKGIFTTMLATPCSGPLLGSVFAFTLGKSPMVISIVFTAVGLGMALPYLLIAVFPSLLAYFPKPGAWMDTFKQLLAFLLLGTVVYLFGGFADDDRMPVFASLIGVWFGCWIIGQVPGWANLNRRLAAWTGGLASAALIGFLAFRYLAPGPPVLAWEPYDETRLKQLQSEGRTVLIDFTAKWCVNCIVNYNVAINTAKTSKLVDELNAVPMLADWTDNNEEIKNKLLELNSNSIPVLAIYPGSDPASPIVLRDLVSQRDVLEALRKAGSSLDTKTAVAGGARSLPAPGVRQVGGSQATGVVPAH